MKFKIKFRFVHFLVFLHCWLYRHLVMCQDNGKITMVSVRVNSLDEMAGTGNFVHLCGGSLITTSVVFTGCSCITKKAPVEKDSEDKDMVELLAADQVQVYAGVAAATTDKDAASQTAMALALNIHTLCDATFVYNYGMIKLANAFRLENGLELSHVLSLDMSDFEKKMMNMKAGDCWTETWVLKEGGDDLVDTKTTKPPLDYTEITEETGGTITEFVETKVAEVAGSETFNGTVETTEGGSGSSGTTEDEGTTEEEPNVTDRESGSSRDEVDSTIDGSTTPIESSVDDSEETEASSFGEITEPSVNASSLPGGHNTTAQKGEDAGGKNETELGPPELGAPNVTINSNITTIRPSNETEQNGTSSAADLVPGNGTDVVKTNATGNISYTNGGSATNKSAEGLAPTAGPGSNGTGAASVKSGALDPAKGGKSKRQARIRRNMYVVGEIKKGENKKHHLSGTVGPKYVEPLNSAKSKIWKRRPKRAEPVPKVGALAEANITAGSANDSQAGAPPAGGNATVDANVNVNGTEPLIPLEPGIVVINETEVGPSSNASAVPSKVIPGSNVTGGGNGTEVLPPKGEVANATVVGNKTAPAVGPIGTNITTPGPGITVKGETPEEPSGDVGCGTTSEEPEDYTSESGTSSATDDGVEPGVDGSASTTEGSVSVETGSGTIEEEPEGSTSSVKTTTPEDVSEDEDTDDTPEPAEHPEGTLPSESSPGSEPPATINKEKPQRVSHLGVNFLDWKECTTLVCPDPSVTCDSDQMDTKWCLNSAKPDVRLCAADTGAPVYCQSSMVAILSNVNLECPKTTTKGVAVGLDGAFEYIKSIMGMPDFQKNVPPVAPVRARKASAPKTHVPTVIFILMGFLLTLLHL